MSGQPVSLPAPQGGPDPGTAASDAAVAVLGSMLKDETCIGPVLAELGDEDFPYPQQRAVFQAIRALFRAGGPVDAVLVGAKLYEAGVDAREYMAQCMDATPTSAAVHEYAAALKKAATVLRLRDAGFRLANARTVEEINAILDEANRLRVQRPGVRAVTFAEAYEQFFDRHDGETAVPSLTWAIPQLNGVVQVQRGHLVVLGAYPGVGKTAFALQNAVSFAKLGAVGYYSCESTAGQLYDRHVARTALLDAGKIKKNQLTEADYVELADLRSQLAGPPITLVDASGMTAEDVAADAQARHLKTVIVDYVQKVRGGAAPYRGRVPTEYERVTAASSAFQEFAVRTGTVVFLLSQMTRPAKVSQRYKDADGQWQVRSLTPPPSLSSLRSSGQLEQDADVVLLMWRENDDSKTSPRILQIAKNRHGEALDKVRLAFDGAHMTFSRMEARYVPPGKPASADAGQVDMWTELSGPQDLPF